MLSSLDLDLFDTAMSPLDPMLHSRPLCPGIILRNPRANLDKTGNRAETRASHHHLWLDRFQKLSNFMRPVESVVSDSSAKFWNLNVSSRALPSGTSSISLLSSSWSPSESCSCSSSPSFFQNRKWLFIQFGPLSAFFLAICARRRSWVLHMVVHY